MCTWYSHLINHIQFKFLLCVFVCMCSCPFLHKFSPLRSFSSLTLCLILLEANWKIEGGGRFSVSFLKVRVNPIRGLLHIYSSLMLKQHILWGFFGGAEKKTISNQIKRRKNKALQHNGSLQQCLSTYRSCVSFCFLC